MSRSCNLHFCDYRIFVMYTDPIEYIEIIFHSQAGHKILSDWLLQ